ncbi:Adenine phosphoribosyltransferase [Sphaceloma murrayae]|uniref:adenine phosphoribosyltransferase n=1 Tax=Sphaceloma murrayae TaxID=2082308 RepID=A0A2K1QGE3_9PEZI|nr:Adenine phosphoribosyltransferase [Sphaceloma murrayae]
MSAQPVSFADHPPHGHPDNQGPSTQKDDKASTSSHPPPTKSDPTTSAPVSKINPQGTTAPGNDAPQARLAAASATGPSQLANLEVRLRSAIRQFPDFPQKGILFEDILPIFASPSLHSDLMTALELRIKQSFPSSPDVIVALESRGFLFGPTLALRLGARFVPVRKKGKLPGPVETEAFEKEYGQDYFQMQKGAVEKGQTVVVVDDLMATGGSAACAGSLVKKLGGELLGYVFLMELTFLKGREKLDGTVVTLLEGQEDKEDVVDQKLPLGRTKEGMDEVRPVKDAGGSAAETRP